MTATAGEHEVDARDPAPGTDKGQDDKSPAEGTGATGGTGGGGRDEDEKATVEGT